MRAHDEEIVVTVVLPAKDEAGGIEQVIAEVRPHVDEVLVVDGRSTDGTAGLARRAGARVVTDDGRGKGAAYQAGIAAARGAVIVFMDCDGSHDAADIPALVAPLLDGDAELVIGSRYRGGSDEWDGDLESWVRAAGGSVLGIVINWRYRTRLTDVLNGFRAIRTDVARDLDLRAVDFDVEQHMICRCLQRGHRVLEVPSHEYRRRWGRSKLPTVRKAHLFFGRLARDLASPAPSRRR